jgi:hypothetical protein
MNYCLCSDVSKSSANKKCGSGKFDIVFTWIPIFPLILNKPRFSKFVNFVVDDMNSKLFWDMNSVIVK